MTNFYDSFQTKQNRFHVTVTLQIQKLAIYFEQLKWTGNIKPQFFLKIIFKLILQFIHKIYPQYDVFVLNSILKGITRQMESQIN